MGYNKSSYSLSDVSTKRILKTRWRKKSNTRWVRVASGIIRWSYETKCSINPMPYIITIPATTNRSQLLQFTTIKGYKMPSPPCGCGLPTDRWWEWMDRLSIIQTPEMGRRIFAIMLWLMPAYHCLFRSWQHCFSKIPFAITPSGGCNGIRQEQAEQSKSFGLYSIWII